MSSPALIGIDIGTQGSKGVLVDCRGKVIATASVEHDISYPRPGWVEHDAERVWWGDFCRLSQALLRDSRRDPREIVGVGLSTIGPTVLVLDREGRPLRPGMLYADTRGDEEVAWLRDHLAPADQRSVGEMTLSPRLMSVKLLWIQRHEPAVWEQAAQVVTAPAYLCRQLTGRAAIDAETVRHFAPLFDVRAESWNERLGERLGIRAGLLPPFQPATTIVGEVTAAAAAATGLAEGTPVITGTMDAYAGWLAAGLFDEGEACALFGSTLVFAVLVDRPVHHARVFSGRYLVSGRHFVGGANVAAGALTRWFRDNFGQPELDLQAQTGADAYQTLGEQAASIPLGAAGLVVLPYFAGERSPIHDSRSRGLILGLTLQHTRQHLYRALLESVAYSFRHILETIAEAGVVPRRVTAAGGGARSELLLQISADVTGIPLHLRRDTVGPALADAYLAGVAVGQIHGFTDLAERWNPIDRVVQPDARRHAHYDDYYRVYRALYPKLADEMHQLAHLAAFS